MKTNRVIFILAVLLLCGVSAALAGLFTAPYSTGFDGWTANTDNWVNKGTTSYTSSGYYGAASPSVKFDTQGDSIISPTIDNPDSILFWVRGASATTGATLKVFARQGTGSYAEIRALLVGTDISNSAGTTIRIGLGAAYRGLNDVQFLVVYTYKVSGNIAFDDFQVKAVTATSETDARLSAGGAGPSAAISSLIDTPAEAQTVLSFNVQDDGSGSAGLNTIINAVQFSQGAANTAANWANYIGGATLDNGSSTWTGTVSGTGVSFTGAPMAVLTDGGASQTWTLKIWLKTTLPYDADNKVLDFIVAPGSFTVDGTGSAFNTADLPISSGAGFNRVDIVATKLGITTQPPATVYANTNFTVRVGFTDVNGGIDMDFPSEAITLAKYTGSGVLSAVSGLVKASTNGQSAWTDAQYNTIESGVSLVATSESYPDPVYTNTFTVTAPPSIVADMYPLYWDGDASVDAAPFAIHITISNWAAGANQDCYLKVYSGSANPYHYTVAGGWKNTTFYSDKPIVHLDNNGNWYGWLVLKSSAMATFQPRVALVSNTSTNLTGAAITGTLLNVSPTGNGAIVQDLDGNALASPGNMIVVRQGTEVAPGNILAMWYSENNGYPTDDGGNAIADGGWRLAMPALCDGPVTFFSYDPENLPAGSPEQGDVVWDLCLTAGETREVFDVILPVELLGAPTLTAGDASVTLNWATASERENGRYEITRNGELVGTVEGAGTSGERHDYSWTDRGLLNGTSYHYELRAVDLANASYVLATLDGVPASGAAVVTEYALHQNFPNPFNPSTRIAFDLLENNTVTLSVFNAVGQKVATLLSGAAMNRGQHTVAFDATNLPTGLYFYSIEIGSEYSATKKMLLVK